MEFTVELRYQSGSSTVMSTEADTADEALRNVRDERRPLVGIHITAPGLNGEDAPREPRDFGDSVWFSLSVGYSGRAEARWLLPKICEAGGITRDAIGAIRVRQDETFVQIATASAGRFGPEVELEPGLSMRRLPGEPNLERPEQGAERGRPFRGGPKPAGRPAAGKPARARRSTR